MLSVELFSGQERHWLHISNNKTTVEVFSWKWKTIHETTDRSHIPGIAEVSAVAAL